MRIRETWALAVGIASTLLALAVAVVRAEPGGDQLLAVPIRGWFVALLLLCIGLSGQLVLSGRIALLRERRLVHAAASLRELTGQLELLATIDNLTGLTNRRIFFERLGVEFRRATRHRLFFERLGVEFRRATRYRRPLSVIMADLDHFKTVNDRFGHLFGDLVLSVTAQALRTNVRESDLVARYGGEEFVLMLPETALAEAMVVAEKLRAAVEAQDYTNGIQSTRITISLGVASQPESALADADDLLRRADEALYAAKHGGRNRVVAASSTVTHDH